MVRFCRFEYRTNNEEGAREFYGALLGEHAFSIVPLPEAARRIPSHWLGYLSVDNVARTADALVDRGGMRLGPLRNKDGVESIVVRDPGDALIGLTSETALPNKDVIWFHVDSRNVDAASAAYRELFGWQVAHTSHQGPIVGLREFSLRPGFPAIGTIADSTKRRQIHPQWLFHFRVDRLEDALAAVRVNRGVVYNTFELPDKTRLAVCDDPHGAGFALREPAAT